MMNNIMREEINFCCDKQKIQNVAYIINHKRLSITTCMLIYIGIFIISAIMLNLLIIFNVLPRTVWFMSGCAFGWFIDIVFGIELTDNIMSPVLMLFLTYSMNTTLILMVMKESMHLITTVRCNCYYGVDSRNERIVYNGEVYCNDDEDDDEYDDEDDDEAEVEWNDVQDGISNKTQ